MVINLGLPKSKLSSGQENETLAMTMMGKFVSFNANNHDDDKQKQSVASIVKSCYRNHFKYTATGSSMLIWFIPFLLSIMTIKGVYGGFLPPSYGGNDKNDLLIPFTTRKTTSFKKSLSLLSSSENCLLHHHRRRCGHPHDSRGFVFSRLHMVRNIDLAEAIIFYGTESIFTTSTTDDSEKIQLLGGVENLIEECQRDDTAIIVLLEESIASDPSYTNLIIPTNNNKNIYIRKQVQVAPNPRDLYESIQSIIIQPKGYGGSSGFGIKDPDPQRVPLHKHCVVLCTTIDQCRAARYVGTRVLCLTDNDLADGIMYDNNNNDNGSSPDWSSICMDDIATPGSFWLNPPHPKDDDGNKIDLEEVISFYESTSSSSSTTSKAAATTTTKNTNNDDDDMSDDELAAILADMDSL